MSHLKLPYSKKFCWCMELITGVRVITGLALIFGDSYIIVGAALFCNNCSLFILAPAVSYYISGGLCCLWFLLLLLIQSLTSKIPRMVVLVHTTFLLIWLLIMIVVLALSHHVLLKHEHADYFEKNQRLIGWGIFGTVLAIIITAYSLWILKSYFHFLETEEASRVPRVSLMNFSSEEIEEIISRLPRLSIQPPYFRKKAMKTLINESKRLGHPHIAMIDMTNIRASQISILTGSHVSTLSISPKSQTQEENSSLHKESTDNKESESSQPANNKEMD